MAILSAVEAKSIRGRLIHAGIIVVLLVGGLTMVYPFLVMVSGALRSEMDQSDMDVVPSYLVDEQTLVRKFLETKYDQNVAMLNRQHLRQNFSFTDAHVAELNTAQRTKDFREFFAQANLPLHWQALGGVVGVRTVPEALRELRSRLSEQFNGDLDALSRAIGTPIPRWSTVTLPSPDPLSTNAQMDSGPIFDAYQTMLIEAPLAERRLVSLTGFFLETIIFPRYGQVGVEDYNTQHAVQLASYHDFRLPQTVPGENQPQLRQEWLEFTLQELSPTFVVLKQSQPEPYQSFLRQKYGSIDELNAIWQTTHESFASVALPQGGLRSGAELQDYRAFLTLQPAENLKLVGPEFSWQDWLKDKYQTVEALNGSHNTDYANFADAWLPMNEIEIEYAQSNITSLRGTYAVRNFVNVFDELFLQGRAFINTVIFCSLSILAALLINPMAAYAMSRFKLPGTYKFLLLLMATMSFPPMVAMIPQFIMLREADLLNTFVALLLPGLANGYLIFLLKGFFDSLPQELYEAARIDGASEVRMFFQITLLLSKPILAVVALQAFNQAYMMFLYALIVCPDESMWILSVWLYQYQMDASTPAVFASVLIASLPTLLVFIFTQRTIMRGIVVPTEKQTTANVG